MCCWKELCVVSYTGRLCDVAPFSDTYNAMVGVPIVSAATLYTDVQTGVKYILVINEALHMPNLPYSLLNPNQVRYAGNQVFDNPFDHDNAIRMNVFGKPGGSAVVPIQVVGTILLFTTRIPMADELAVLPHFHLTLTDEWKPHTILLSSLRVVNEVPSSVANIYDVVEDVSSLRVNDVVNDGVER
jgi:hypothetical protein